MNTTRSSLLWLFMLVLITMMPAKAQERFPTQDDPDVRVGTPNDPGFDCRESDNEDDDSCAALFDQQVGMFGFAPDDTENSVFYISGPDQGDPQISGVRADAAWKTTIGLPEVVISIHDTGIRWNDAELRRKVFLNRGELPLPQLSDDSTAADYDANGDGSFNVDDYADDSRVGLRNDILDGQDLIVAFSDGTDADNNGYIDDIAGWDFFEDDNDPSDTTSYSAARGHGTGRMREAGGDTNNGAGDAAVCPRCMVLPMRVWDTFVSPGDSWAVSTAYAADIGVSAQVVALGMLQNSRSAKAANRYAYLKGMNLMQVSSDLNTANHNFPTNYVESVYINGCVADVHGLSSEFPGIGDFIPAASGGNVPVGTWFRNSNLTQYGAHAHVCYEEVTGSQATGHAGGGAGLIVSAGIENADANGGVLTAGEVKQILTLSAEDVLPENTLGTGTPDPAAPGWDEYFGYGRANLGAAVEMVASGNIPPEALIESPVWWEILDPTTTNTVAINGVAQATRANSCSYELQWGLGIEPGDAALNSNVFANGNCSTPNNALGLLPIATIAAAIPGSTDGTPPANPNSYTFTVRLVVTDDEGRRGEDRKVYFAHHDPTWHDGWPKFVDTGGETSPVLADLDGNGTLEFIDANSSGELHVWNHDGTRLASFNNGAFWQLSPTYFHHADAPAFASGAVPPPTSGFRTPAVYDVDDDLEPEIVAAAADGRIFILSATGVVERELGIDISLSEPEDRTATEHPKRGLLGAPVIGDLDPAADNGKEIIVASLDGHIYVWQAQTGQLRDGFPVPLRDDSANDNLVARGELISTPTLADLDGDGDLEIVSGSSEVFSADPSPPDSPPGLEANAGALVNALLENSAASNSRVYAINGDGSAVPNFPVTLAGLLADVLPFVGPQHTAAAGDLDGDGDDEIVTSLTTGDVHIIQGDGSAVALATNGVVNGGATSESSRIVNLFEYPVIGDLNGAGGLDIAAGGATAGLAVNLLLVGQNVPFNHVVQAWDSAVTESYLPGYPTATEDYMLLSTPIISNVDGSGNAEIVVGNGLYMLHAYDNTGADVANFPKLTGGWAFAVPAIGDVDDDGLLELTIGTREGYRFIWDLDGAATLANNSEWWTEAHDECHSNRHGTDCRPPATPKNLMAAENNQISFVTVGDDANIGRAARYEIRTSSSPIEDFSDWQAATSLGFITVDEDSRTTTSIDIPAGNLGVIALLAEDDVGNRSRFTTVDLRPAPTELNAVVTTVTMASGTGGDTLDGGTVSLSNPNSQAVEVSELQFSVSDPDILASLTVNGGGQTQSFSPVTSTITLSLTPAISVAAGGTIDFDLTADLATNISAAVAIDDYEPRFFSTAMASESIRTSNRAAARPSILAVSALLTLLGLLIARLNRTPHLAALLTVFLLASCGGGQSSPSGQNQTTNADPNSSTPDSGPFSRSTTIDLIAVNANFDGSPITINGLPQRVSVLTNNSQ